MDEVTITYTKQEIQKTLENYIKPPHHKLISRAIVDDLINTDNGVKNLLLALEGIEMKLEDYGFYYNETITVDLDYISTWDMDIELMKEKEVILNNTLEGTITDFNKTKSNCIGVSFNIYNRSHEKDKALIFVRPKYLKKTML